MQRPLGRSAALMAAPCTASCSSRHSLCVRAAQSGSSDFGESVRRIAKKVQGALPVVGLLSRLASPEGGFDEVVSPGVQGGSHKGGKGGSRRSRSLLLCWRGTPRTARDAAGGGGGVSCLQDLHGHSATR